MISRKPATAIWTPADWAWAGGLLDVLLPSLHYGVPVVARRFDKFDPGRGLRADGAARGAQRLHPADRAAHDARGAKPARPLRFQAAHDGSGGESLGVETLEWGKSAFGLTINEFYGQTECNLVLGSCAALGVSRPGAIGKPVPGHEVAVIDARRPAGEAGEVGQIAVQAARSGDVPRILGQARSDARRNSSATG